MKNERSTSGIMAIGGSVLHGLHVVLRPPRPEDAAGRLAFGNDPEIMRMFGADLASLPPLT